MISVFQGIILRTPKVRKWIGLGQTIVWKDEDLPMNNISMFDQVQNIKEVRTEKIAKG